jgi:hypothetical protein
MSAPRLTLAEAVNPYHQDPGKTYTTAIVENIQLHPEHNRVEFEVAFGYIDEDAFVRGKMQPMHVTVAGDDWSDLVSILSTADEPGVSAMARAATQYLVDKALLTGTVS